MSKKLHVDYLKKVQKTSKFDKDFIKNSTEDSDEELFIDVNVQYP